MIHTFQAVGQDLIALDEKLKGDTPSSPCRDTSSNGKNIMVFDYSLDQPALAVSWALDLYGYRCFWSDPTVSSAATQRCTHHNSGRISKHSQASRSLPPVPKCANGVFGERYPMASSTNHRRRPQQGGGRRRRVAAITTAEGTWHRSSSEGQKTGGDKEPVVSTALRTLTTRHRHRQDREGILAVLLSSAPPSRHVLSPSQPTPCLYLRDSIDDKSFPTRQKFHLNA